MRALIFSDVFPIILFSWLLIVETEGFTKKMALASMLVCRICSLIFHLSVHSWPDAMKLDYIGICCMVFSSIHICEKIKCPSIDIYNYTLISSFFTASILISFVLNSNLQKLAVWSLAVLGHYPLACVLSSASTSTSSELLQLSAVSFFVGFVIVEPVSHVAWHWCATAGQVMLLMVE